MIWLFKVGVVLSVAFFVFRKDIISPTLLLCVDLANKIK